MKVRVNKIKVRRISEHEAAEYYEMRLLQNEIRLQEVPISLLRGGYASILYITAFRVDRGVSEDRFLEDLNFLKTEVDRAQALQKYALPEKLKTLYDEKLWDYQVFFGENGIAGDSNMES